jgi:hypothetical protein
MNDRFKVSSLLALRLREQQVSLPTLFGGRNCRPDFKSDLKYRSCIDMASLKSE